MGFKKTSDIIAVSFGLTESAANTYTQEEIALQLDVLNNEIFVVLATDINPETPELVPGSTTATNSAVTATSSATMANLSDSNCIARAQLVIRSAGGEAVPFSRAAEEAYAANLDYIALISTNNFFVSVQGSNNAAARSVSGRVWGYRARADATTYAALVQSEVLSA
jgi:hypothetical protein